MFLQGSVEERIMEIIKQRKAGQGSGSGERIEDLTPCYGGRGKARAQQDVAGSLRTDRQNLRIAELEVLFKVSATSCLPIFNDTLVLPLWVSEVRSLGEFRDPYAWMAGTCALLSWSFV